MLLSLLVVVAAAMAPTLPPHEAAALETAAVAVADMERLATNAEEKELAERNRLLVARVKRLAEQRAAARSAMKAAQLDGRPQGIAAATKQVREVEQAFSMQYLGLQSQMQNESRRFTLISTS